MYCYYCGKDVKPEIKEIKRKFRVPNQIYAKVKSISITEDVCVCPECGAYIEECAKNFKYRKEAVDRFCAENDLLTAKEIRAIREFYDVSQEAFAKITGIEERTIAVLENEEMFAVPNCWQNNLLTLMADPTNFATLLELAKGLISEEEYQNAKTKC